MLFRMKYILLYPYDLHLEVVNTMIPIKKENKNNRRFHVSG